MQIRHTNRSPACPKQVRFRSPTPERQSRCSYSPQPPYDEHNAQLLANAQPSDWRNPNPQNPYHLVVVGAGTAGLVTAMGAAALGARVALIERHLMGGDCLNYGCVPSKALIRCATAWADMRDAGAYGLQVNGKPGVDFSAVMRRMQRLRAAISHHDSAQRQHDGANRYPFDTKCIALHDSR